MTEFNKTNKLLQPPNNFQDGGSFGQVEDWCKFHTKQPSEYYLFDEWAKKMGKTHNQVKCPNCGYYKLWIKK